MLILKNGHVLTMTSEEFIGDVAIANGKIAAVGKDLGTAGDDIIDINGKYVMPGMVDAHCHIGMWEDSIGEAGADGNEMTNPTTPELRAIDAINPFDKSFREACDAGVTTVVTGPGSANVIGGTFCAMKTHGNDIEDMLIKSPIAMKAAFGENPKVVYGEKHQTPSTRMGTAAVLRKALIGAQEYARKLEEAKTDPTKAPDRDLGKEALVQVIRRELPLKIHAHRADDILTAIRIAKEFNIRFTLDHCTEGYLIPNSLKDALEHGCEGIIIGPLFSERSKLELINLSFKAPAILYENGIKFAMMTDHPVIPEMYLAVTASVAVKEGLPELEALKMMTINAAEIIGIQDRVGSLDVGKDADIAVYSGHPIDVRSRCVLTLIDGEVCHSEL